MTTCLNCGFNTNRGVTYIDGKGRKFCTRNCQNDYANKEKGQEKLQRR